VRTSDEGYFYMFFEEILHWFRKFCNEKSMNFLFLLDLALHNNQYMSRSHQILFYVEEHIPLMNVNNLLIRVITDLYQTPLSILHADNRLLNWKGFVMN